MPNPRPLRVLHLAKYAPSERGGIETIVGELLAAFARHDQPITVDCYCYAPRSSDERLAPTVTLRRRRTTQVVASAPISLALLRAWWRARRSAEIVHVHLPNPWAALLVLAVPTRAPVVASVHAVSTRYGLLQRPHAALTHRILRRADSIIVSAQANAELFGLGAYRDKVTVVPYGIDPARIRPPDQPGSQADNEVPADTRRVLFVGRLVYYKGLDTLLSAAPNIDAELIVLGDGPLYPQLHAQVTQRALIGKVRFVRDADDTALASYLAGCSVFVLPSSTTSESFGLSVLEAMAAGKPVVVTELGTGLDELVHDAGAGRIVPPRDPAALAQAINELLADPAERARLGAAGRRVFERGYTNDQMADRILAIYTAISHQRPANVSGSAARPDRNQPTRRPPSRPAHHQPELRLCLAAAPGGHLTELLSLRPAYADLPHFFVLNRNPAHIDDLTERVYWVNDYGQGNLPRRVAALVKLALDSVRIYRAERPNALLTTGPFTGWPLAVLIRARGGRVLFVECSAQVTRPSRSGRLFRRVAHRFFVQWPALQRHYPDAEYGGLLL